MTLAELRAAKEQAQKEYRALAEKIEAAKDKTELDAVDLNRRKLIMKMSNLDSQISEAEAAERMSGDNDPAWRKVENDEPDTRSLKPLNGVIKGGEVRKGSEPEDKELAYRKAFMDFYLRKKPIPAELRADAYTTTTDVSAVIPITVINKIVESKENPEIILSLINITHFKGGVRIPVSNVKPVATWVEERKTPDKQKKTVDQYISFGWFKLKCPITMSLETTVVTLDIFETTFVRQAIEAMDKALAISIISGDGTTQPKGILKETAPTGQALTAAIPSYQLLIDAEAALPEAYENNVVWMMTKKSFMAFYGITDANGQPIARVNAGFTGRPERTLLGRPVITTGLMDSYSESLAAGKIFAFLFNFKDYTMNINLDMRTKWYEDNDTDDMVFKAIMLADGKVVDKGSLVTIAKAAKPTGT